MSEQFVNASAVTGLPLPIDTSLARRSAGMAWQDSGSEGFPFKPLFEDPDNGMRTWLMRVEPGAFADMHSHAELEQVYVLEGSFYDQNGQYGPGDYIVRAPGSGHTAGSKAGATILLFYSPAQAS